MKFKEYEDNKKRDFKEETKRSKKSDKRKLQDGN